jgi:hypothetical protein
MGQSNAERQRTWRQRHQEQIRAARKAIHRKPEEPLCVTEEEVMELRRRVAELERETEGLRCRLRDPFSPEALAKMKEQATQARAQARAAAKGKSKSQPREQSEIEKALRTENQNLRKRIHGLGLRLDEARAKHGPPPPEIFRTVVKCLHPDRMPSEAERAEACGMLTSWWARGWGRT